MRRREVVGKPVSVAGRVAPRSAMVASCRGLLAAGFAAVGAFALGARSRDAALRLSLSGSRSIQITGANNGRGLARVELYQRPPMTPFSASMTPFSAQKNRLLTASVT